MDPDSYDVIVFSTGSDFDALRFDGALRVTRIAARLGEPSPASEVESGFATRPWSRA
jgi:hypothetical protein